jgi:hypothetical protein
MPLLETVRIRRYAGWSAYVSAGLAVIGDVALFLFYALEAPRALATGGASSQVFGPLSDNAGLFSSIFMLPLPVALYQLTAQRWRGLSWAAMTLGVLGLLTTIIAQMLLVARVITFAVNLPFTLGGLVLLGVWMILANHRGRAEGALPPRLAWLGELTGTALASEGGLVFLLVLASALNPALVTHLATLAQQSPALIGAAIVLAIPGALAYFLGVPIWLIGVGRRLLAATPAPARSERPLVRAGKLI